ncbi:M14 family zinc carboxypeptidase [Bdellovibrionota bacterium FG-1]
MIDSTPSSFVFGRTAIGLPIPAYRWERGGPEILVLGGVHGDETEGVACAYGVFEEFSQTFSFQLNLTLIPAFNLDGVLTKNRLNGRGVDLNRNLPTQDWNPQAFNERYPPGPTANSESESQALVQYLNIRKPRFVLSLHSWTPLLNTNGDCQAEALAIQALTHYRIDPSIGYPTPGCLGTYAGIERGIPTLTYEIERGLALPDVLRVHVPAVIAALGVSQKRTS